MRTLARVHGQKFRRQFGQLHIMYRTQGNKFASDAQATNSSRRNSKNKVQLRKVGSFPFSFTLSFTAFSQAFVSSPSPPRISLFTRPIQILTMKQTNERSHNLLFTVHFSVADIDSTFQSILRVCFASFLVPSPL